MELTEDEIIQKDAKQRGHCSRNTFLPYQYEWSCFSCNYNVIKQKHDLSKIQRKNMSFVNRLKYVEHKIFCLCIEVYKIYEGDDFDKKI